MKDLRQYSQYFRYHWLNYFLLFGCLDLFNQAIIIPVFRWITVRILRVGEIPFVSLQNTVTIAREHPFVILGLLVELVVLLIVLYSQLVLLLQASQQIIQGKVSWHRLVSDEIKGWHHLNPMGLLLLLGYFLIVIPVGTAIFRIPLLAKIKLLQFMVDYLTRKGWLFGMVVALYVIIIILGVRLLLALPLMILRGEKARSALKKSWQMTSNWQWWRYCRSIVVALAISVVVIGILDMISYYGQVAFDLLPGKYPLYLAVINLSLLQLGIEFLSTWAGTVSLWTVLPSVNNDRAKLSGRNSKKSWLLFGLILVLLVIPAVVNNGRYLNVSASYRPVTISHRGVAEENGVPNTIPAMKKTSRLHPDYIEMDLHETKDHQFVVMHDENLNKLTGINKRPAQLTLKQLTSLTARENGYQAPVASFDQYLSAAEKRHQKLLVEIKTTPTDSSTMIQRFNHRYGQRLIRDHDLVHSLDYNVVTQLTKLNPQLQVLYVQPYDLGNPDTRSKGFSMEYSTLTQSFMTQAHRKHQPVFVWTVNKPASMMQMLYNHVDGIITDNLKELNRTITTFNNQQSYARLILNYILVVPIVP